MKKLISCSFYITSCLGKNINEDNGMLLGNLTCCVYLALFFWTVQYLYFDLVRIKCVLLFRPTKFNF